MWPLLTEQNYAPQFISILEHQALLKVSILRQNYALLASLAAAF